MQRLPEDRVETLKQRVQRGAELLDKTAPGWERLVSITELDLGSCFHCVLGQLFQSASHFSGYGAGVHILFPDAGDECYEVSAMYGFTIERLDPTPTDLEPAQMRVLKRFWSDEIRARRKAKVSK